MKEANLPSIGTIIVTYNCAAILTRCLKSITEQDYPTHKLEILVVDGGSTDPTIDVAKRFGAKVIVSKADRENQERRKALGLRNIKSEIVAYIDSDNILPHREWLRRMVEPFMEDEDIVATQPLRYSYRRSFSSLNRYFALFGVNDPVVYYLNRRDRLSWAETDWRLLGQAEDEGDYFSVRFSPESMPTLGANGYLARREVLVKSDCRPCKFFHIDVNYDLIKMGYNKYGIVKDEIIHLTGNTFLSFIKKRMNYMRRFYLKAQKARRYRIYSSSDMSDRIKLGKYVIYTISFVKPVYDSIQGYRRIRDAAWFLHPVMCWAFLLMYTFATVEWALRSRIDMMIRNN